MRICYSGNNMLVGFNYFLSQADLSDSSKLEIRTSGKWLNVHPAALVFAAALSDLVGKENTIIKNEAGKSGLYLDRMGLYNYTSTPSTYDYHQHEESGRFVPIRQIKTSVDQSRFISDLVPLLHLIPEKALAVKYIVGELVRNTIEHSRSSGGAFVAAQYRTKSNVISLGIADTGIGLKASLDQWHRPKDDLDAIKLALSPGISGTTWQDGGNFNNAGAGLFIVKSLSKMTRNYFVIYSGDSAYKLLKYDKRVKYAPRIYANPFKDKHSQYEHLPNFHGTLIGLDISLDDTEEFNNLLEVIKDSISKAIRERKEQNYKEIKFI